MSNPVAKLKAPSPNGKRQPAPVGAELLDAIEAHLGAYVAFPTEHERVAVTCWTGHAHALDYFESTPRLAALSPEPGSGKTRLLEVLETLVPAPMHVLSASTAAIFRTISSERPTLLLDEVDAIFGRTGRDENNEDLRALLNAGHRAGATIPRCVGPTHEVKRFPVYAAVALAGLGDLPDTLMTRSVVVRMRRRAPSESVLPFRARRDEPLGNALRDQLAAWVDTLGGALYREPPMPAGIEDRPADVWEPLLVIADAAGGDWPDRARAACLALASASHSREASLGIRLLSDLRAIFGDADRLHTATILDRLHRLDEAPWAELRGKPLDPRGLAWRLKQYGIASKDVKIDGTVLKGYQREDLWDAWQRYTPEEALPALPTQPPRSEAPSDVAPAEEVALPAPPRATHPGPVTSPVAEVAEVALSRTPDPEHFDRALFGT